MNFSESVWYSLVLNSVVLLVFIYIFYIKYLHCK